MKDKFIYIFLGSLFIIVTLLASKTCSEQPKETPEIKKHSLKRIGRGDMYQVEYQGQWYTIIETHNGLGICSTGLPLEVRKANGWIEENCPSCKPTETKTISNYNY
tara:strand:- start:363 stop:680 length:318 start_codon:yes stop_codon:yes gene_type:complete